jgi:AcrR family transcriptional regulator
VQQGALHLIVAYLRDSDKEFWAGFEQITGGEATARGKLLAFFAALQTYAQTPACYGCPFLNVATEYPETAHPGHRVALEHKASVRARFRQLAAEAGAAQPDALAAALHLLMDGAYVAARLYNGGAGNPAAHLADAARQLIDAYAPVVETAGQGSAAPRPRLAG